MDSLTRVINTIEFKKPDRFPIMHAILPAAWLKYGEKLHSILTKYPTYLDVNENISNGFIASAGYETSSELIEKFPLSDDFVFVEPRTYQFGKICQTGYQSDEWGCIWGKKDPGIVGQVVKNPLSNFNIDKLKNILINYNFPDPNALWRYDTPLLEKQEKYSRATKKYFIAYIGNLFELLQWLFGFENLFIYFYEKPKIIEDIIEKIVNYNIETMKNFSKYSINGVGMNDDWGTQESLMIKPEMWKRYFKPAYKKIIKEAKNRKLHFHFHTDGNTVDIIEDLIEIGVDVINPQLSCINLDKLSYLCKGRVCIRTDIDRQYLLPYGSTEEVRKYIIKIVDLFGIDNGGLIFCGEINSDAKLENIEEMYKCFEEYGLTG